MSVVACVSGLLTRGAKRRPSSSVLNMSGYRHGVLIHNYNEDHFGLDLKTKGPLGAGQAVGKSLSHIAFDWKQPEPQDDRDPPTAKSYVQRHLLFGHTGDMTDPHRNLQKTEFATCSRYFYQAPQGLPYHSLSAEKFAVSDEPLALGKRTSVIADKIRLNWGGQVCPPPSETFKTMKAQDFTDMPAGSGVKNAERYPRAYGDFSKGLDAVKLARSQ